MIEVNDIELGILAYIKTASTAKVIRPIRYYGSWPMNWDKELQAVANSLTGVWATFGGWAKPVMLRSGAKVTANFAVAIAAANQRSPAAAQQGGPVISENGAQLHMHDIIGLLMGNDLGMEIDAFELGPVTAVPLSDNIVAAGIAMIVVQFTTTFILEKPNAPFQPTAEFMGQFRQLVAASKLSAVASTADTVVTHTLPQESQP